VYQHSYRYSILVRKSWSVRANHSHITLHTQDKEVAYHHPRYYKVNLDVSNTVSVKELLYYGLLCSEWSILTDVSGQHIGPIFNPFQSNFPTNRILPSSYLFWAVKRLVDYL
jgi:hypothetical protein